jgi:hypothetical protein
MNRQMTIGLVGLMCGVVVIAGFCGVASALDVPVNRATAAKSVPRKTPAPIRQAPAGVTSVARGTTGAETYTEVRQSLLMMTPTSGEAAMTTLLALWDRLVPAAQLVGPLEIRADNFSLSLDPKAYQFIPAADGGRIIVDARRNIPPLIRTLIQEKDPALRIVSDAPTSGKRFSTQLLQAAGFYSVEPDFTMEFGDDPRLSVRADYRIERTPESLMRNEAVLLYTDPGGYALPQSLQGFLGNSGFQVIEPDVSRHNTLPHRDRFIQVPAGSRLRVADTVLAALDLDTEADKIIKLTGWVNQGISLSVHVDRIFEFKGRHYAVAAFDGNPVTYNLMRLLEHQEVTVVVLEKDDDFHAVTRKLLTALKLPASFDMHRLWPLRETPYTVQMSGYLLHDPGTGRNIFLTDREVTPLLLDLIERNGYAVTVTQP